MLSTPQIVETETQPAAVIHLSIPATQMPAEFGPAVGELMSTLAAQGIEPVGAVFAHHLKPPGPVFDFELGVKVTAPVAATGRVKPGALPAARVARATYTGPYEGLGGAWGEFMDWIEANDHKAAPSLWELYSVGPQSTPDTSQWQTELTRPLA